MNLFTSKPRSSSLLYTPVSDSLRESFPRRNRASCPGRCRSRNFPLISRLTRNACRVSILHFRGAWRYTPSRPKVARSSILFPEGPPVVNKGNICSLSYMHGSVTSSAEGNQVLFGVIAKSASGANAMNLEFGRAAAVLAAPAVPLQHLLAQLTVGLGDEPEAWTAREQASHGTFLSCSKNCCCCGRGRN